MASINGITFSQIHNLAQLNIANECGLSLNKQGTDFYVFPLSDKKAMSEVGQAENKAVRQAVLNGLTNPKFHDKMGSVTVDYKNPGSKKGSGSAKSKIVLTGKDLQMAAIANRDKIKTDLNDAKVLTIRDVREMMGQLTQVAIGGLKSKIPHPPQKPLKKRAIKKPLVKPGPETVKMLREKWTMKATTKKPLKNRTVKVPTPPKPKSVVANKTTKIPTPPTKAKSKKRGL